MYWNLPAACGEVSDDGHSSVETLCATFCCPCYWLCCALTYCVASVPDLAMPVVETIKPYKTPEEKSYKWREKNAPRLPVRRRRRLSMPVSNKTRVWQFEQSQNTFDQHQSLLFRLPIELREMIWNEVMGDKIIYITAGADMKLKHVVCTSCIVTDSFGRPRMTYYPRVVRPYSEDSASQVFGILSLSKTCRRIYSETFNLAYSQNTFFFDQLACFRWFATSTLRLDSIKALRLFWDLELLRNRHPSLEKYYRADWQSFHQFVLEMKALKDVRIKIKVDDSMWYPDVMVPLNLLRNLNGLETFQIHLPFSFINNTTLDLPTTYECIGF